MKKIYSFFRLFGFDVLVFLNTIKDLPFYFKDLSRIKKQKGEDNSFVFGRFRPMLGERFSDSGTMSGAYFHQDLLVAKKIFTNNPVKHIDIGSRVDGFVAHVATFREIEIVDIRSQESKVKNITFIQLDLMKLPDNFVNCYDSVSSLHAIEHFGLGRYGDPVDYFGHLKALENIYKILRIGGRFYFSVPIGEQRIEFNAHRVFSVEYLLSLFKDKYKIQSFSYVDDQGNLFEDVDLDVKDVHNNFNCHYGCGIFELLKI
jgi:SAM-dependent methyltransferase